MCFLFCAFIENSSNKYNLKFLSQFIFIIKKSITAGERIERRLREIGQKMCDLRTPGALYGNPV